MPESAHIGMHAASTIHSASRLSRIQIQSLRRHGSPGVYPVLGFAVSRLSGSAHSLASCVDHVWGWIHRSRNPECPSEPSFRVSEFGTEESRIVIAYTIFWGEGFFLEKINGID